MDEQSGASPKSRSLKNFQERRDDDAMRLCLPQMVEISAFKGGGKERCNRRYGKLLEQAGAMLFNSFRADEKPLANLRGGQTRRNR